MDPRHIRRLGDQSPNFGFLAPYPLLLFYGAGAEALIYIDAQAAMFKARAFGEVLAADLVRRTGAKPQSGKFYHQVRSLNAGGVLVPRIYTAFDRLRSDGNRAVHDHLAEVRTAARVRRPQAVPGIGDPSRVPIWGIDDCYPVRFSGAGYPMLATHDPRLIAIVEDRARWFDRGFDEFEFQLLYGIRPDEQRRLREEGHTVRVYVPYGDDWYGYLMRRLAERPANVAFVVRALTSRR